MVSIDKVMDVVTGIFLEILSGAQLLTRNVNLYTCYKVDVWT